MQVIKNNNLFTQVFAEESEAISGGGFITSTLFSLFATTALSPGGTTVTAEEQTVAFLYLINAAPAPGSLVSP